MAESRARTLANLANTNALSVDGSSLDVGISSTSPDSDLNVGASIKMDGPSGIITASKFSGDGSLLIGVASTDNIITGTAATFNNEVDVNGFLNVGANIQLGTAGVITATSFTGDGANLTNVGVDTATVNTGALKVSGISTLTGVVNAGGDVRISGNLNAGITTLGTTTTVQNVTIGIGKSINYNNVQKAFISDHAVGLGSTTTAGRNAGLGTASGTIAYNDTLKQVCYYAGDSIGWIGISSSNAELTFNATGGTKSVGPTHTIHAFTSAGPGNFVVTGNLSKNCSIFVVGGGGGGAGGSIIGGCGGGGGGGGGIAYHPSIPIGAGTYALTVGGGGSGGTNNTTGGNATSGENSTFDPSGSNPFTGAGGGAGRNNGVSGLAGGSGGGAGSSPTAPGVGGGAVSGNSVPSPGGTTYGNIGGGSITPSGDAYWGGGGGGAGEAGKPGGTAPAWPQAGGSYAQGGDGIGSPSVPWLPTSHGDSSYFSGGGAAGGWSDSGPGNTPGVIPGGNGGGADSRYGSPLGTLSNANANTGGGGAGGNGSPGQNGTNGGSGIILIRYENS